MNTANKNVLMRQVGKMRVIANILKDIHQNNVLPDVHQDNIDNFAEQSILADAMNALRVGADNIEELCKGEQK